MTLRVDIYGDLERARRRTPLTVVFGGVRELVSTLNCLELADSDDQIGYARLNETSDTLDLEVHGAGGYLRIVADRFGVSTALRR